MQIVNSRWPHPRKWLKPVQLSRRTSDDRQKLWDIPYAFVHLHFFGNHVGISSIDAQMRDRFGWFAAIMMPVLRPWQHPSRRTSRNPKISGGWIRKRNVSMQEIHRESPLRWPRLHVSSLIKSNGYVVGSRASRSFSFADTRWIIVDVEYFRTFDKRHNTFDCILYSAKRSYYETLFRKWLS